MLDKRTTLLAAIVAAAGIAGAPISLVAQTTGAQPQQAPAPGQDFSKQDLKSYAAAAVQIGRIDQAYQTQMQAAQSTEQQKQVQDQALRGMAQAVEGQGLSVEKYNRITEAAQADPATAQEIRKYAQQEVQCQ